MTFELVRYNWPNTAAILALAVMPIVALTTLAQDRPRAAEAACMVAATNCQTPAITTVAMAASAGLSLE